MENNLDQTKYERLVVNVVDGLAAIASSGGLVYSLYKLNEAYHNTQQLAPGYIFGAFASSVLIGEIFFGRFADNLSRKNKLESTK